MNNTINGQSAAKPLNNDELYEEGPTTIPNGSTGIKTGKRRVYLKVRNVIYKITNTINNKIYIGSASFFDKRMGTHINLLTNGKHKNPYLQNAYNKYGDVFNFEILEHVDSQNNLLIREQFWLDYFKSYNKEVGYNISKVAGSNLGNKMSEYSKQLISKAFKGKTKSEENAKNIKNGITKKYGKPILAYTTDMIFIKEYSSISECSRDLKVSIACISKQCSSNKIKKRKQGYIFKYKDIV